MQFEDIRYSNHNFWWYYVSAFQGYDDDKEVSLMEAIGDVLDIHAYTANFDEWYRAFTPKEKADDDGILAHPNVIEFVLRDEVRFKIAFHVFEIQYYLNDIYMGNLGGHFEAWFFTWKELLAFDDGTALFLFLLPMTGIEETQRKQAEKLISERLKQVPIFSKESNYIAQLIANGLVIDGAYSEVADIGTICTQNDSVRNVVKYPQHKDDVVKLNQIISGYTNTLKG